MQVHVVILITLALFSATIPSAFADHVTATVSIPEGTSVPGCEETNSCYVPYEATVDVGGEVVWTNDDTAAHTVTSGFPDGGPSGSFDSGLFMAGATFSEKFDDYAPGEYHYFCLVHPWMQGIVIVEAAETTEPTRISVSTDKNSYSDGDSIRVFGRVTNPHDPEIPVSLQVTHPDGMIVTVEQIFLSSNNQFETQIMAGGALWDASGTYTLKVLFGSQDVSDSVKITYEASEEPTRGISVSTDRDLYSSGDTIRISGDIGSTKERSQVTIRVTNPEGDNVAVDQLRPNRDGSFGISVLAQGQLWEIEGIYRVVASYGGDNTSTTFLLTSPVTAPPGPPSISVSTDKSNYMPGELVTVTVKSVHAVSDTNVGISVIDPSGSTIVSRTITTSSGTGSIDFKLSDSAVSGDYRVNAAASVNGNNISDSTTFRVKSPGPNISIMSVEPTDQQGNPVSAFDKGKLGFVKVVINSQSDTNGLVTINLFDSELTTLGIGSFKSNLSAGQSEVIVSFFIPDDAISGTADIYANVFSDWPSNGGTPLTGEKSSQVRLQ